MRVLHTSIGNFIALLSGYLLFPMWESRRLPLYISAAFRAEAVFLRALHDVMRGKHVRPISEFRRDAAVAVSNAVTAAQRLLSEPPNRRGDVESSLATVNNCRRILHALAAISDYPTREPIQFESDALTRLVEALAKALDDLASSLELEPGTGRGLLPDLSELSDCLENAPQAVQIAINGQVSSPKNSEALSWLFNHLKNAGDLVLATREVPARLLRSELQIAEPASLTNG